MSVLRSLPILILLAAPIGSGSAQAQSPVYSGQTVIVQPAPVVSAQSYVIPTRRTLRAERRTALRPTYQGRQPLSFASYSDRYNTRVVNPQPTTTIYQVAPR